MDRPILPNRLRAGCDIFYELVPQPPDFNLDWEGLSAEFAWIRALADCPQDSIYHAEGDVWIHTRMVCESLLANAQWRALPDDERHIVFIAALMHDIGKPACTRMDDGRITSRGHSTRGAIMAREILAYERANSHHANKSPV